MPIAVAVKFAGAQENCSGRPDFEAKKHPGHQPKVEAVDSLSVSLLCGDYLAHSLGFE